MSILSAPPTRSLVVEEKKNLFNTPWLQWLTYLYQALGGIAGVGAFFLNTRIPDVTAVTPVYLEIPRAGTITSILVCVQAALSAHLENIVVKNGANTIGTVVIPSASVAGTVVTLNSLANNILAAGSSIKLNSSALSSNAVAVSITVVMQYSA